jgi:uncharacterized protein (TIGR03382 family)
MSLVFLLARLANAGSHVTAFDTEPGAWFDLDVSWDGATLRVAHDGATDATSVAGVQGIRLTAEGTAELDAADVRWTEADPPDTADTDDTDDASGGDSATSDTGPSGGRAGAGGDATSDDAGCGCANTAPSIPWASLGAVALLRARRRAHA